MIPPVKLRGFFVCNQCRQDCGEKTAKECLTDFPRKQYVNCLGHYCDAPCELRTFEGSTLSMRQLADLAIYLGNELNKTYKKDL